MKKIKRNEMFTGTVCMLEKNIVSSQTLVSVLYVEDAACVKIDDETYFNPLTGEFLPHIDLLGNSNLKKMEVGNYYIPRISLERLNSPYVFWQDEDGTYLSFEGHTRSRKKDNE